MLTRIGVMDLKYCLIAFDMDGTLLDNNKKIPPRCLRALWSAAERGCLIVPATGRMLSGLPEELRNGPIRYHILINGALVFDSVENKILYEGNIAVSQAVELCKWLDNLPVLYDCYIDNEGFMAGHMCDGAEPYFENSRNMFKYVMNTRTRVEVLADYMEKRGAPVQKMQIYFRPDQEELRRELLKKLPQLFPHFAATTSLPNNVEINSIQAGKEKGLAALCRVLGINTADCIVFGDGSNDRDIIAAAGLGVAMANAEEQVKAVADRIALSNAEEGVAVFIEELIASGEI